jgi:hypothetical protein
VSGLWVRHWTMAAGHNALRGSGPGQKHALKAPWREWVVPVRGRRAWVRYRSAALSNFVARITPRVPGTYVGSGARYGSPRAIIAQAMRAILLASATAATLADRRSISFTNHGWRV